jgi:hypothetical protein
MLPLPVPERGGSIEALQSFLNLSNQDDFVLVVAWLGRVAIERSLSAARNTRRAGLDEDSSIKAPQGAARSQCGPGQSAPARGTAADLFAGRRRSQLHIEGSYRLAQNPRLRRTQTVLRALGLEAAFGREGRAGSRVIWMRTMLENTVSTVSSVRNGGSSSLTADYICNENRCPDSIGPSLLGRLPSQPQTRLTLLTQIVLMKEFG